MPMFGSKTSRAQKLGQRIGSQLRDMLAFPRTMNGGKVPDTLRYDHYVLGYHFMMCLNLYIELKKGKTDPEEQGLVLANALPLALDREIRDLAPALEELMTTPDDEFKLGTEHANAAYDKVSRGDATAFQEFLGKIRVKY
jgi:hypothetical protein